ncbi:hypothetical protein CC86DRAFT_412164 [Ophiobolus disseminans]|uniref:Uncharacterized protein n=1 Tax=Ophiobolus disseminans TaxID=1469910 RepID=A0A6A6ZH35_9PLEO|nr:hypothetical protein CC86DRAFT_412164 [Ophiobolus disseminans]
MTTINYFAFAPAPTLSATPHPRSLSHPHPRLRPRSSRDPRPPRSRPIKPSIRPTVLDEDDDYSGTVVESGHDPEDTHQGIKRRIWRIELDRDGSYKESRKSPRIEEDLGRGQCAPLWVINYDKSTTCFGLLTPPSSPQGQETVLHTPSKPSRSSPPQGPPSAQTPPSPVSPPSSYCGHAIHPGYKTEYKGWRCPHCRLVYSITQLRAATDRILEHGCSDRWLATCTDRVDYDDWVASTKGGMKRHQTNLHWDEFGNDTSYRHCKKRLHNLLSELDYLWCRQLMWEQELLSSDRTHGDRVRYIIAGLRKRSALAALADVEKGVAMGFFTRVEEAGAVYMHKRGRELEIARDPEYPDDESMSVRTHSFNRKTLAQMKFVHASDIPLHTGAAAPYAHIISPSKPKTARRPGLQVAFNDEVKVCVDSDIDVLRKHATVAAVLEPAPFTAEKPDLYKEPKLDYVIHQIKHEDGPARYKGSFFRDKTNYQPGRWAVSTGSEPVDTSGSKVQDDDYDAYNQAMLQEAREMRDPDVTAGDQDTFFGFLRVIKWPNPERGTLALVEKGYQADTVKLPFKKMRQTLSKMLEVSMDWCW